MRKISLILMIFVFLVQFSYSDWQPKNTGLFGGSINVIKVKNNIIYAGTNDGIYLSFDFGNTWEGRSEGLVYPVIEDFAFRDNVVYAVSKDLYYSTDSCKTWKVLISGDTVGFYRAKLAVKDSIIIVSGNYVRISNDLGKSYRIIYHDFVGSIEFLDNNIILSTGYLKLSKDNGATWSTISNGIGFPIYYFGIIGNKLLVKANNSLYLTTDLGVNWTKLPGDFIDFKFTFFKDIDSVETIILVEKNKLYISKDFGNYWKYMGECPNTNRDFQYVVNNGIIFSGSNEWESYGIQKSTDMGKSWESGSEGISNVYIKSLSKHGNVLLTQVDNIGGAFRSTDNGNNWSRINVKFDYYNQFYSCNNLLYAVPCPDSYYLSYNGGINWKSIKMDDFPHATSFYYDEKTKSTYMSGYGIAKTTDEGYNWEFYLKEKFYVSSMIIIDSIFIAYSNSRVIRSTNYGNDWEYNDLSIDVDIKFEKIFKTDQVIILTTTYSKNYFSFDNGKTWIEKDVRFDGLNRIIDVFGNTLIGYSNTEVLYSSDIGNTWKPLFKLPFKYTIPCIAFIDNKIVIGINRSGIFVEDNTILVKTDILNQELENTQFSITPNPACDYIEISLDSPSIKRGSGDALSLSKWGVSYEIFNIFGELQETSPQTPLLDERGFKIDVSNLPAGVYFIRIGDKFEKFIKI